LARRLEVVVSCIAVGLKSNIILDLVWYILYLITHIQATTNLQYHGLDYIVRLQYNIVSISCHNLLPQVLSTGHASFRLNQVNCEACRAFWCRSSGPCPSHPVRDFIRGGDRRARTGHHQPSLQGQPYIPLTRYRVNDAR
jgi:hypothetical protein